MRSAIATISMLLVLPAHARTQTPVPTVEIVSTTAVNEIKGSSLLGNGFLSSWKNLDPAKVRGLIVSVKVTFPPGVVELDTRELVLAYTGSTGSQKSMCLGIFVRGVAGSDGEWLLPDTQKGAGFSLLPQGGVVETRFLFAVPAAISQASLVYKDSTVATIPLGRSASAPPTGSAYRIVSDIRIEREGITRNVEVRLVREKSGAMRLRAIALDDSRFALRKAASTGVKKDDPFRRIIIPIFLPGDSGISVQIDSSVGFTIVSGLKLLDPVVLRIADDGVVEADRVGVRARQFEGRFEHKDCFMPSRQIEPGSFDLSGFMDPKIDAGALVRTAGSEMHCEYTLDGRDGAEFVSREVLRDGRTRTVFVRIAG